jgi:diaminopimelate decarboxylase
MAVDAGVGLVVVDGFDDIDRLEPIAPHQQAVLVRVTPDIRPLTHAAVATGQAGPRFGPGYPWPRPPSRGCGLAPGCA